MDNPCECCQSKRKFIRQINGNYMHSMVIPEWFANFFGGKIPGTVQLEAPDGNIYDVGVTEIMNRTILKTGWAAFVDANQIEENYSLMFRHNGNARFEVTIFDSTGKEKVSCCARTKAASDVKKPSTYDVDNSSRSCGGTTQSSAGEGSDSDRSQKECPYHYKKQANTPAISYSSEGCSEDNPSLGDSVESDDRQMLSDDIVLSGHCYLTEEQEVKIQALVSKMRPEIPVLVAMMKKTNVKQYGNLVIRKDYALKYFPCEDTKIILQVPRRSKHWQCSLYIRPGGRCNLYMGKFVRENRVQEGDVCIFQPIMSKVNARGLTLMVHVLQKLSIGHSPGGRTATVSNHRRTSTKIASTSRVTEEPDTNGEEVSSSGYEDHGSSDNSEGASEPPFMLADTTRLTQAQTKKVLEKVSAIESELRVYVVVMNKSNVRRHRSPYLSLGVRYVSRYLKKKYAAGHRENRSGITLVLQREGESRTWDTELRHWSDRTVISKGWSSFARTNNLREDDLCLFEVMENEEPLKMMVYIIRREKCLA